MNLILAICLAWFASAVYRLRRDAQRRARARLLLAALIIAAAAREPCKPSDPEARP
jgi:hypothetical protein